MNWKQVLIGFTLSTLLVSTLSLGQVRTDTGTTINRPQNNDENRLGYAPPSIVFKGGSSTTIMDWTVWATQDLQRVHVGYRESPNRFDLRWRRAIVETNDGKKRTSTGIESIRRRNFIGLILKDSPSEVLWVPFAAITTIAIEKVMPKSFRITAEKEVYGRFGFQYKDSKDSKASEYIKEIEDLIIRTTVSLRYLSPSGRKTISGMLADSLGNLNLYVDEKWKSFSWMSVTKIIVVHKVGSDSPDKEAVPSFLYRTASKYADGWYEYSFVSDVAQ